jgi:preprotein translocase subunit SecA
MGILDWLAKSLFKATLFQRYDDAYTLTRDALWNALKDSIESEQNANKSIWLVVHFTDTFLQLQNQLDSWDSNYEVVSAPVNASDLQRKNLLDPSAIKIVLSDLMPSFESDEVQVSDSGQAESGSEKKTQRLAIIVVERHPLPAHDKKIETFARQCRFPVELGYYMALDDAVIKTVVNETTIKLVQQLGMQEHELISSHMISKRLAKALQRNSQAYTGDRPADSAEQWLEMNGPSDDA